MDKYLNQNNVVARLLKEYYKYGTLIVAVDFDCTIFDYHNEGIHFDDVITLLQRCVERGMKLVIYTANQNHRLVSTHCENIGLKIEGINKQLLTQFENRGKLYYNILLDDRAGLKSAYEALAEAVSNLTFLRYNVEG